MTQLKKLHKTYKNMPFLKKCTFYKPYFILLAMALIAAIPAAAQVKFSGNLTVNQVGSKVDLANPVYYPETVTQLSTVGPSWLSCSSNPVVDIRLVPRSSQGLARAGLFGDRCESPTHARELG